MGLRRNPCPGVEHRHPSPAPEADVLVKGPCGCIEGPPARVLRWPFSVWVCVLTSSPCKATGPPGSGPPTRPREPSSFLWRPISKQPHSEASTCECGGAAQPITGHRFTRYPLLTSILVSSSCLGLNVHCSGRDPVPPDPTQGCQGLYLLHVPRGLVPTAHGRAGADPIGAELGGLQRAAPWSLLGLQARSLQGWAPRAGLQGLSEVPRPILGGLLHLPLCLSHSQ